MNPERLLTLLRDLPADAPRDHEAEAAYRRLLDRRGAEPAADTAACTVGAPCPYAYAGWLAEWDDPRRCLPLMLFGGRPRVWARMKGWRKIDVMTPSCGGEIPAPPCSHNNGHNCNPDQEERPDRWLVLPRPIMVSPRAWSSVTIHNRSDMG